MLPRNAVEGTRSRVTCAPVKTSAVFLPKPQHTTSAAPRAAPVPVFCSRAQLTRLREILGRRTDSGQIGDRSGDPGQIGDRSGDPGQIGDQSGDPDRSGTGRAIPASPAASRFSHLASSRRISLHSERARAVSSAEPQLFAPPRCLTSPCRRSEHLLESLRHYTANNQLSKCKLFVI